MPTAGCERSRGRDPRLREEDPIDQFIALIEKIDLIEIAVHIKFEDGLKRHNKFNRSVLGMKGKADSHHEIDLRDYAKYVLRDGTNEEKRELMVCFKSRVSVTRKIVALNGSTN